MKILSYLKDKRLYIASFILSILIILGLLIIFNTNRMLIIMLICIISISYIIPLISEYIKKQSFYKSFKNTLDSLDKKYLITEMISKSDFKEGKLLLEYLSEIDKYMHEEVNNYKYNSNELKEYIELWCHEIKTPIATSKLIIENNNSKITKSIYEEIEKIENYVEQVLYYSRSDIVEKDYMISETDLKTVVDNVIKRNKKDFIGNKIKLKIGNLDKVKSDSKWLEFIINQIISNSIKYSKSGDSIINIYSKSNKNNIVLYIEDNGIGINEVDVNKVFDKGFTGHNGRKIVKSTGIGLYLCKKLCKKLGHEIIIESLLGEKTIVSIVFPNSNLTKM